MRIFVLTLLSLFLIACQTSNNPNSQSPICRELRAKMIFNGSKVDPNKKFQENADQPKLEESYHNENCV